MTTSSPFLIAVAAAVVIVMVTVGTLVSIGRFGPSATCLAASEWTKATQEMYFVGNDPNLDEATRVLALHDQFGVMANVVLPPVGADSKSEILPLLHQHNSEMEYWLSFQLSEDRQERETARLQLNKTVRIINGFLVVECGLEPVLLHQPRSSKLQAEAISEEARIKEAVTRLYALINDERWLAVWNSYTREWREKCSFDAMVESLRGFKGEVAKFNDVNVFGSLAVITYNVARLDSAGNQEGSYDYSVTLVKQDDEWLWEEPCH